MKSMISYIKCNQYCFAFFQIYLIKNQKNIKILDLNVHEYKLQQNENFFINSTLNFNHLFIKMSTQEHLF